MDISTDLTAAEVFAAQVRSIHAQRGTVYLEDLMATHDGLDEGTLDRSQPNGSACPVSQEEAS